MTLFNTHTTATTARELAVWDLANVTSAGTRYNLDPFRSNASGLSDHYLEGATFTFGANAEPRLVTVTDDDGNLNDGDYNQDTAGGGFTPEYAYRIRPEGGTAADDIIIYATEVGGHTVNGLVATAPIEAGVTYTYIEHISNHPTVAYNALVSTIVPVPDGVVDGLDATEEMGLGYTDEKTDMITTGADVIEANGGDDTVCADDGDDIIYGGSADVGGLTTVALPDANSYMQFFYTDLVIDQFDLDGLVIEGIPVADIQIGGVRIGDLDLTGVTIGDLILGNGPLAGLINGDFDNITLGGVGIKDAFFDLKHTLGDRYTSDADKAAIFAQFQAQLAPALAGIKLNLSADATPAVVDIYDYDRDGTFDYGQRTQNIDNNELFQNATRAAPGASFIVRPEGGTEADDVTIYLSAFDTTVVGFASDKPLTLTQNYMFVGLGDLQPSVPYADLVNTYYDGPLTTVEDGTGMNTGDDLLKGEGGNDILYGQDGNDTLEGGEGADQSWGGDDRDLIIVSSAEHGTGDVVVGGAGGDDFDTLDLTGAGLVTIVAGEDSDGNGQDGTVTFSNGGVLTFTNIEEIITDPQVAPVLTIAPAAGEPTDPDGNLATAENGDVVYLEVTRTGPTDQDLVVTLTSDDDSEATVPATVTILAGSSSVLVEVTPVDEGDVDGTQLPVITADATDFDAVSTTVSVADDDVNPDPDGCVDGEETGETMSVGYNDADGATNGGGDLITNGDDVIKGNGGDDKIRAGRGDDEVDGGTGRDKLYGQGGNDTLNGNEDRDVLVGGGGNDVMSGGQDNDRLIGGAGADTMSGGDDRDTFVIRSVNHGNGDVVDGGDGATVTRDFDTLDLRKAGLVRFVNQVEDTDGNGFDGTIEFVDADGTVTGSMDYTNIERFRIDGEYVEKVELGNVTYEVIDDFRFNDSLGEAGINDDAYSLKLFTAQPDSLTGFETVKAYCLSAFAPLDTSASFDQVNLLNGELFLANTENAIIVRDQSENEALKILSGTGVNGEAGVDNMDLINWIINQDWDTMSNGDGLGESYTDTEVQFAIWSLTDGVAGVEGNAPSTAVWDNALEISQLAIDNGEGYEGGQFVGVIVEPTNNADADGKDAGNTQPFIIAVDADFLA